MLIRAKGTAWFEKFLPGLQLFRIGRGHGDRPVRTRFRRGAGHERLIPDLRRKKLESGQVKKTISGIPYVIAADLAWKPVRG